MRTKQGSRVNDTDKITRSKIPLVDKLLSLLKRIELADTHTRTRTRTRMHARNLNLANLSVSSWSNLVKFNQNSGVNRTASANHAHCGKDGSRNHSCVNIM